MKRIPTLDGWRAVAIAAVVIHHLARWFYQQESAYSLSVTRFGAFGVDVFFGLSGLLITKLLLDEFGRTASFDLRGFYIRRAFRILPPSLMFLAVITVAGMWRSTWEVASCLLFFRNYVPDSLTSGATQHLWSLAVEEHFYLLWPGLLALVGARRSKNLAAGLALAVALWRMIQSQFAPPLLPLVPAHFRSDIRLDALLWGCVVAFILDNPAARARLAKQLPFMAWCAMAGLLGLCIAYYSELNSVMVAVLIPILLAGTTLNPQWTVEPRAGMGASDMDRANFLQLVLMASLVFACRMGSSGALVATMARQFTGVSSRGRAELLRDRKTALACRTKTGE